MQKTKQDKILPIVSLRQLEAAATTVIIASCVPNLNKAQQLIPGEYENNLI